MKEPGIAVILFLSLVLPCHGEPAGEGDSPDSQPGPSRAGFHFRGKRDPFRSLIVPKKETPKETPSIARPRPPGLAGLSISEIKLAGIASSAGAKLAFLQGQGKAGYFGKVGDRLYDGFISEITASQVFFTEERVGDDGKKVQRTIRRELYPDRGAANEPK